jgi:hypothetical protein
MFGDAECDDIVAFCKVRANPQRLSVFVFPLTGPIGRFSSEAPHRRLR